MGEETEAQRVLSLTQGCTACGWQKLGPGLEAWWALEIGSRDCLPSVSHLSMVPLCVAEAGPCSWGAPPLPGAACGPGSAAPDLSYYCDTSLDPFLCEQLTESREPWALVLTCW